ncbi:MAG: hypothetical protein P8178_01870 [Candidatus Thiodiazotropha sp.]
MILALALCWHSSAEAFFCFNFFMHGGGDGASHARRWPAYPPPPPYPPPPMSAGVNFDQALPPIKREKRPPDLIDGYRFRPLEVNRTKPVSPPAPADWRD